MPMIDANAFHAFSPVRVETTGSRTPSTMNETGLYSAIVAAGSSISVYGKNAELRNRITNTIGNSPCTTEALPERSAIAAPMPPNAIEASVTNTTMSRTPITPSSICAPKTRPTTT